MNHDPQLQSINDFLQQQIQQVKENQKELTDLYITTVPYQERDSQFLENYLQELEEMRSVLHHLDSNKMPKVLIGTKVSVFYEDEGEAEEYIICFPEQADPDEDCISFLSPVGRQLLLKGAGESTLLSTPAGELPVKIISIQLVL